MRLVLRNFCTYFVIELFVILAVQLDAVKKLFDRGHDGAVLGLKNLNGAYKFWDNRMGMKRMTVSMSFFYSTFFPNCVLISMFLCSPIDGATITFQLPFTAAGIQIHIGELHLFKEFLKGHSTD